jgi:DNA-binding IscR family transcriptional regulator
MEMHDIIIKALKEANEPLKSKQIAEATGLDQKEINKVLSKLKKEGKIVSPKMCVYTPA